MSVNITQVYVKEFESDVHASFQSEGFQLKNAIRVKNNVVGSQAQFPVVGKGMANQKAIQDDITPMNVGWTPVTVTLQDWVAGDYTDIFAQAKINWDDRMEMVKICSYAIGRRCDQMIIDSAVNSGTSNTIAAGGTGFTYAKFLEAFKFLRQNAATRDICCMISADAENDLMLEAQLTQSFYVDKKPLGDNGFQELSVMGVRFIVIPNNLEGGIPTGQGYMFAKEALGIAIGVDFRTEINYVPQKTSWLVNSVFSANAVAIDNTGIVQINYA